MAGVGQPWLSRVTTQRNRAWSLCRRYSAVPKVAAKVFLQVAQRKRRSFLEWTVMLPLSLTPLSGQSGLAQNKPWGPMARLRWVVRLAVATRQSLPWAPFWLPPFHGSLGCYPLLSCSVFSVCSVVGPLLQCAHATARPDHRARSASTAHAVVET